VGTSEGPGIVVDSKILVQLVLVQLEHDGREIAVPVEELLPPDACPAPTSAPDPFRGMRREDVARRVAAPKAGGDDAAPGKKKRRRRGRGKGKKPPGPGGGPGDAPGTPGPGGPPAAP
jgi:hypothetical protein